MTAGASPLIDQIVAAAREMVERIGEMPGVWLEGDGPPIAGLREIADELTDRALHALMRDPRTCGHLGSPQPCYLALWDPVVRCTACEQAIQDRIKGTPEEFRCDRCGEQAPDDGLMRPLGIRRGPLLIYGAICKKCHPPGSWDLY